MTSVRPPLISVSAYQSLLQEDDYDLKEEALKILLQNVNIHWSEIANDINQIIALYRDKKFEKRKSLAAILLSKLYFNLRNYDEALRYALEAQNEFNINDSDEFVEVIVNKCIENYIALERRSYMINQGYRKNSLETEQDRHLLTQQRKIVEEIIDKNIKKREFKLPLGIALQTHDRERIHKLLEQMNIHELIEAVLPHLNDLEYKFKQELAHEINAKFEKVFQGNPTPQQLINVFIFEKHVDDHQHVGKLITHTLLNKQKEVAYTIALEVSEINGFTQLVLEAISDELSEFPEEKAKLTRILSGELRNELHRIFLTSEAKTDPHYQTQLKAIESKNSVAHESAILSLSLLQAFTEDDSFLEKTENLEWAAKASHWAKFATIASLALIYKNNKEKAEAVFKKYLPESNTDVVNHFPNGGAIYGLGLVFAGSMNQRIIDKVIAISKSPLQQNQEEAILHATSLALGLIGFASNDETLIEELTNKIHLNSSVIGEAACIALGLVGAGKAKDDSLEVANLITCIQQTQHEKVNRGASLGIALLMTGSHNKKFIQSLEDNIKKSSNFKLALPLFLSTAFFKTSNAEAIEKLLYISNDINNEVKRAAIIGLGFVMYQDDHLIEIIKLMIYSYNSFIRYGCVIALAVGAKDTKEAIELIWPLLSDSVDYVRQASYIALALLMQVSSNNSEPKLAEFRKTINESIAKKGEDVLAKMGALLAIGILDIGGRNMVISLTTRSGIPKNEAVAGMLVFLNYWNWFPYINFIGLTLTPTAYIGINSDFKIPKSFQIKSNSKPSLFGYPANIVKEEKKETKKDTKVQLSTTVKAKNRANKKALSALEEDLHLITHPSLISQVSESAPEKKEEESKEEKKEEKKQQVKEQLFTISSNPTRVTEKQRKYIQFVSDRYQPVLATRKTGIVVLYDNKPNEPEVYVGEKEKPKEKKEEKKTEDKPANLPSEFTFTEDEEKKLLSNIG